MSAGTATRADIEKVLSRIDALENLTVAFMASVVGLKKRTQWEEIAATHRRDYEWVRRWMAGQNLRETIDENVANALRRANCDEDEAPPTKGYMSLEEVAAAGRTTIAAVPGVGRVSLRKLDAALPEHDLVWADAE
ncbi:MAG: hypothetical protein R2725_13435 [Solirubrobacterales bacterium]